MRYHLMQRFERYNISVVGNIKRTTFFVKYEIMNFILKSEY